MTIHFTIHALTLWLLLGAAVSFILGYVVMLLTGSRLEMGSLVFLAVGSWSAVILILLAIGTML